MLKKHLIKYSMLFKCIILTGKNILSDQHKTGGQESIGIHPFSSQGDYQQWKSLRRNIQWWIGGGGLFGVEKPVVEKSVVEKSMVENQWPKIQ